MNEDLICRVDNELERIGLAPTVAQWWQDAALEEALGLPIETEEPCWWVCPTEDTPPLAALCVDDLDVPGYYDPAALLNYLTAVPAGTSPQQSAQGLPPQLLCRG
jgi:hypothetical protein